MKWRHMLSNRNWIQALVASMFLVSFDVLSEATKQANTEKIEFKKIQFDEGMKHQLNRSMPLTLGFPSAYEMLVLDPVIQGVVWGLPDEIEETKRSKSVPAKGGFFHGRLTSNVGYDKSKRSFICGPECGEADIENQFKKAGIKEVKIERAVANGIPLLFIEADTSTVKGSTTKTLYMAYIATLIDTNVMLISYRPPINSEDRGKATWEYFKQVLIKSN